MERGSEASRKPPSVMEAVSNETTIGPFCPEEYGGRMQDCAAYPACGCDHCPDCGRVHEGECEPPEAAFLALSETEMNEFIREGLQHG